MWFPNAEVAVNPVLLLLLGVMVGTLSGFFGVGGGFLITGGLLVFGVPPVFAVGTGLALIMGSSIINTLKHRHLGNVDFRLGMLLLIGTIPGVFLAEQTNSALEEAGIVGPVIRYVYILFLGVVGGFIIFDYLR
ncbi:MAG: sulfite exporter TauE/SafE family protein, partial [Chloroflexi bacterium]|nr:sulfite exporter TauE/SafE family protein [Chloroflexota bacterium]MCI0829953.1 sulfite exporter TauE/SafE family protein [Chloroflexota bacterium]MCI0864794.1 sulfite exporter TauE/SafE family protein [Chloroflexota bacterium]